jgi:methyl acetate hydrolase
MTRRDLLAVSLTAALPLRAAGPNSIDDTLRTGIERRKIPAAVGMAATRDKTFYAGAFGKRDAEGTPVALDSIFAIASMTKAVTTVAAMQLVEQGKLKLNEPVARHLPQLANPEVLTGFDTAGKPILRPATTPVTLQHLLTHTSGLCYNFWDEQAFRFSKLPAGSAARPLQPLMFEPGTRWQYGQGVDWAGRLVEKISGMSLEDYFQAKICRPLEMPDTSFLLPPAKFPRLVGSWNRDKGADLEPDPRTQPAPPASFNGGGGLYSTAADYTRFMQMILRKGRGPNGAAILQPRTIAAMSVNQIGSATAGKMRSFRPDLSSDVDIQPGFTEKWGLGFLINTTPYNGGRAAGSLAWAGLLNTFFWIDPKSRVCAVLMMQFLPFVDKEAVGLLGDFERAVYAARRG